MTKVKSGGLKYMGKIYRDESTLHPKYQKHHFTSTDPFPTSFLYANNPVNLHQQPPFCRTNCPTLTVQRAPAFGPKSGDHIARGHMDPRELHTHFVSSRTSGYARFSPEGKPRDPDGNPLPIFCKRSLYPLQLRRGLSPVLDTNSLISCDRALKQTLEALSA